MRCLMRNRAVLTLLTTIVIVIAPNPRLTYARTNSQSTQRAKTATENFFRKDLSIFGGVLDIHLKELRSYLSPSLCSLIRYELRRRNAWVTKNPEAVPPVLEDFFVCNHRERPAKFRVSNVRISGGRAWATVHFLYLESTVYKEDCKSLASLI